MQYKVPQNVDIEDKVIAGLTLRQFIFLITAGGIVLGLKYGLPASLSFLFMPLSIGIAAFGAALAFYKINDRPFEVFLISAAKTLITPNKRIWQREGETKEQIEKAPEKKEAYRPKKNIEEIRSNLEKLAMVVDSGIGAPSDRASNISADEPEPVKITDVLEKTEKPSQKLDEIIADNMSTAGKKEKPISTMASVIPNKNQFEYESLELKDERAMEEMVKAANRKQQELEAELDQAKITKFDHKK